MAHTVSFAEAVDYQVKYLYILIDNRVLWGHGGGQVFSALAFYSDDQSSNPAGYLNFLYEKTKINEKGVGPSLQKYTAHIGPR